MNDTINTKQLSENDIDSFFELRLEALLNAPSNFRSTYEEEKSNKQHYKNILQTNSTTNPIFGAFINETLIGCVGIHQGKSAKTQHQCTIWGMYVKPEHRNKNIGKLLIETAITYIKNNMRCVVINLTAESNNLSAIKLYESFGFKKWGKEAMSLKSGEKYYDEDHMALLLY